MTNRGCALLESPSSLNTVLSPLDLVRFRVLMARTTVRPEITIGLIDGPVAKNHPDLVGMNIHEVGNLAPNGHAGPASMHATYVAGILSGRRGGTAPSICPDCTILVRPIFLQVAEAAGQPPSAAPGELAQAIVDCIEEGARLLNLSIAAETLSSRREHDLAEALNFAAARGVVVAVAAGNQGLVGSTAITRHPWVIPVVACDS